MLRITPTMSTAQLRELEKDGMIYREIFITVPPTVEYSITNLGKSVKCMINKVRMCAWEL
ncbi:winged helix-turn-helix transcriptional regulator [Chitinophaga ginsengisoli]|uniref:winged helix-turn-helix transcriptional regulator n=1 Tax=Chitinophaga ginsengisoli TaxID=363837 RepID=UPI0037434ABA